MSTAKSYQDSIATSASAGEEPAKKWLTETDVDLRDSSQVKQLKSVIGTVEKHLQDKKVPQTPADLINELIAQDTTRRLEQETIRQAIWYLLDQRRIDLTDTYRLQARRP